MPSTMTIHQLARGCSHLLTQHRRTALYARFDNFQAIYLSSKQQASHTPWAFLNVQNSLVVHNLTA